MKWWNRYKKKIAISLSSLLFMGIGSISLVLAQNVAVSAADTYVSGYGFTVVDTSGRPEGSAGLGYKDGGVWTHTYYDVSGNQKTETVTIVSSRTENGYTTYTCNANETLRQSTARVESCTLHISDGSSVDLQLGGTWNTSNLSDDSVSATVSGTEFCITSAQTGEICHPGTGNSNWPDVITESNGVYTCNAKPAQGSATMTGCIIKLANGDNRRIPPGGSYNSATDTVTPPSTSDADAGGTSCEDAEGLFMSWLICPGASAVASILDGITQLITLGLKWEVLDSIQGIWSGFLPIANIVLAIVFLLLIYSTATGSGLSNYSVKKILPKLILVAVAINVSFYICDIIVDLSNIVGDNIKDLIIDLAGAGETHNVFIGLLTNAFQFIGVIGVVIYIIFVVGGIPVVLAVLTILLAIVARQVVLALLIIVSPIAFALALLPNTDKLFKKWLDVFVRLVLIYPMFMAVWGGITVVQYNITNISNDLVAWFVALFLPIVPLLAIIPLFKASGGLMGKMTGAIQKGVNDNPLSQSLKETSKKKAEIRGSNLMNWGTERKDLKEANHIEQLGADYRNRVDDLAARTGMTSAQLQALDINNSNLTDEEREAAQEMANINELYNSNYSGASAMDEAAREHNAEISGHNDSVRNNPFRRRAAALGGLITGETRDAKMREMKTKLEADQEARFQERQAQGMQPGAEGTAGDRSWRNLTGGEYRRNKIIQEGQAAQMRQSAAEQELKTAVEREKMGMIPVLDDNGNQRFNPDGTPMVRYGALSGVQSRLNTATRQGEAMSATVQAEAAMQGSTDISSIEQNRIAEAINKTATDRIDTTKTLTNAAEIEAGTGVATQQAQAEALKSSVEMRAKNVAAAQTLDEGTLADQQRIQNARTDQANIIESQQKTQATQQRTDSGRDVTIAQTSAESDYADTQSQAQIADAKLTDDSFRDLDQNIRSEKSRVANLDNAATAEYAVTVSKQEEMRDIIKQKQRAGATLTQDEINILATPTLADRAGAVDVSVRETSNPNISQDTKQSLRRGARRVQAASVQGVDRVGDEAVAAENVLISKEVNKIMDDPSQIDDDGKRYSKEAASQRLLNEAFDSGDDIRQTAIIQDMNTTQGTPGKNRAAEAIMSKAAEYENIINNSALAPEDRAAAANKLTELKKTVRTNPKFVDIMTSRPEVAMWATHPTNTIEVQQKTLGTWKSSPTDFAKFTPNSLKILNETLKSNPGLRQNDPDMWTLIQENVQEILSNPNLRAVAKDQMPRIKEIANTMGVGSSGGTTPTVPTTPTSSRRSQLEDDLRSQGGIPLG